MNLIRTGFEQNNLLLTILCMKNNFYHKMLTFYGQSQNNLKQATIMSIKITSIGHFNTVIVLI